MTLQTELERVSRFRALIAQKLGLAFDDTRLSWLSVLLDRRAQALRETPHGYLDKLEASSTDTGEIEALIAELTVTETYFFRHAEQLRAFSDVALPERLRARPPHEPLRVLCAGCASGEEPYTLAILMRENPALHGAAISVRGIDIHRAALERARAGRYSTWSLRETPADVRARWFVQASREHVLSESIRQLVTFEWRNLAEPQPDVFQPGVYDVVFMRNVLMYLTPEVARAVIAEACRALVPGGFLFIGYAETLRGLSDGFLLRHACDAFFYQKHDRALGSYGRARGTSSKTSFASSSLATEEPLAGSWADAIEQAATRVHALTTPLASRALTAQPAAGRKSLDRSFELLASERFDEALDALPDHSDGDPDVLLLRAALLVHSGKLEAAKRTSSALLEIDAFNVGAHYLLALCSDGAGERSGALEHDRIALHLEPTFAMAHLHLGLIARRDGDHPTARRELSTALSLLPREESARILLYGGGFSRAALVELCKSELIAA